MYTIKFIDPDGHLELVPALGNVGVSQEGQPRFREAMAAEPEGLEGCRAIVDYRAEDGGHCSRYLYDGDQAYVMNTNGRTVATVRL